jgi:hypothetical protein
LTSCSFFPLGTNHINSAKYSAVLVAAVDDQTDSSYMELDVIERGKERSLAEELADKYKASKTYKR